MRPASATSDGLNFAHFYRMQFQPPQSAAPEPAAGATFYGNDAWSIHKGSCGLGYIFPDRATGWDVAAVSVSLPPAPPQRLVPAAARG